MKADSKSWATAYGMFRDASVGKRRDLRVRPDNPCSGIAPPDRGIGKAKPFDNGRHSHRLWPPDLGS